ncbi:MAG: elongation factor P, partial [Anaerolineales bacterium]
MIDANALRKGVTFTIDGELYKVMDYHHHKPGRGLAT